jgi:predicted transposase/invertase (TIGR01784 family)
MPRDTDASYKLLFSAPEVVRDLVLGFIPDDWLHSLDYTTLEKIPGSYITDDLRDRADDVVWRVKADGEWVYLYLLIEFQSTADPWMAVRMMTYLGLLYQDLIRRGDVLPGRRLPPVLPIVLYNGKARTHEEHTLAGGYRERRLVYGDWRAEFHYSYSFFLFISKTTPPMMARASSR